MRRALSVAAALTLLLAGCSEPSGSTGPAATAGAARDSGAADAADRADGTPTTQKDETKSRKAPAGARARTSTSGQGDDAPPAPGGSRAGSLATAVSIAEDSTDDKAGDPAPAYTEVVGASITGRGDMVEVVLELGGPIPERVGERDNLLAGVGIEYEGKMGGIALMVQGTRDGWAPGIQREGEQRELEEGWRIDGNRFVWTVPWSDLGGPREFRWGASLRWFQFNSPDTSQAEQSQDRVPDSQPATFPSARPKG